MTDRITPPNLRKTVAAAFRRARIKSWPRNGLRHSFASYHLAKFQDAPALALQMGHTTTAMLFAHYREVVTPEAAAAYWKITPHQAREGKSFIPKAIASLRAPRLWSRLRYEQA